MHNTKMKELRWRKYNFEPKWISGNEKKKKEEEKRKKAKIAAEGSEIRDLLSIDSFFFDDTI